MNTTDLATRGDTTTDLAQTGNPEEPASSLMLWVLEAKQAHVVAQGLASTSFVPASLRGKPHDVMAAILTGQELGLQPMASLRSMDVIQGTPALRAHAMRGLVQSKGHEVVLVESTPDRCVMRGRRNGSSEWQEITWTFARAAQLGLTGKDQWKKQPQTMLVARATGEICRLIAADALYAMPYAAEELHSDPISDAQRPARSQPVTVQEVMGSIMPADPEPQWADTEPQLSDPDVPEVAWPEPNTVPQ